MDNAPQVHTLRQDVGYSQVSEGAITLSNEVHRDSSTAIFFQPICDESGNGSGVSRSGVVFRPGLLLQQAGPAGTGGANQDQVACVQQELPVIGQLKPGRTVHLGVSGNLHLFGTQQAHVQPSAV